jgi:segregation and condensation protein B
MAAPLDPDLSDLSPDQRWREWLRRVEAVLFASAAPVGRDALARVVGQGVSIDLLIADLGAELADRPYEVAQVGAGWVLRTRPAYGAVIRAAADIGDQALDLRDGALTVLAAIAYHQPITRDGLKQIFGREISRELIGRLVARGLIGPGPRAPKRGAPYTYVTTEAFLMAFDLSTLADLPELDGLTDAGFAQEQSPG